MCSNLNVLDIKMERTCRTCLKVSENLCNLFEDTELPHKIETIASIQVSVADNLPHKICNQCVRNVHLLYDFRSIIIRSSIILKDRYSSTLKNEENSIELNSATADFFSFSVKSEQSFLDEELLTELRLDPKEEDVNQADNSKTVNSVKATNVATVNEILRLRKYSCKLCSFSCTEYAQWRNHKRKHVACPKSVCSICGKTVRTDNLRKHISIHTEAPVACKDCGKTCKNTESLRGHALIHKEIKLQCNTCGKIYKHRAGFTAHVKRHALGDVKTVACPICSKLFYEKRVLEKHIRSHTGERPYPCEYCKKGFSSSNALKTHKRQHTNERPYACELCPMAFPQKVSLRTHLKSKHPEAVVQPIV